MDYTTKSATYKIRKTMRYVQLYGVRRTLAKIKGQYHMRRRYKTLPHQGPMREKGGRVGLIGCGNFAYSNIAYYLVKNYGHVIRGVMDVDIQRAASLYEAYGARYYTEDADDLIGDPEIDLVYVASNHASHAEYAIQALRSGKNVHIEKPHVVTFDQLQRLCAAMSDSTASVNLGFNRPRSKIGRSIAECLDRETGPAMFNWFIAGHKISADHWYFKDEEGGRILGNLCHWTDFVLQLVRPAERYPLVITPTRGHKSDCDIAVTYQFGDESIAAITFSAKGHTFEGVRERFAAHRGNALLSMDDFHWLTIEIQAKKKRIGSRHRNHGHEENILESFRMDQLASNDIRVESSLEYTWETGILFLKTREALETNQKITIDGERTWMPSAGV